MALLGSDLFQKGAYGIDAVLDTLLYPKRTHIFYSDPLLHSLACLFAWIQVCNCP